ncbi:hypothetical protein N7522_001080 [Penicillium canescens]|uniref:Uncharacterized protein n=1 Tax=Penicillium canescens TaxID=5083 RepID=A0AAD6NDR3_PENCN|nr:uncharacterized protein N7446_008153 [Penicillium canescens]KAJ6019013.1 hypothetical protein N7522_001080 [Penicillium canescens]KAJ6057253.1 hypothetical protein N7460_000527 [Penicillium canescens]KAJ6058570.1 hypothetical protein N7446_008153 [Penicillium canescens]
MLSVREDVSSSSNLEGLVRGLCIVLSIGLLSFTDSHVYRFDLKVWNKEMEEIAVGLDEYSFQPRKLACLDDFVGGPAWILGQGTKKEQQQQEGMKLSITIQDLQELWGPVSLLGDQLVHPLIHWTTEVPECLTEKSSEVPILLSNTSRILIGTTSETKVGLVVNQKCKSSIATIHQQIACRLLYPGTCKSSYMSDGYDVQLVGGQYVTAGIIKKYKRILKRTLKAMLIEDCAKPGTGLVPLLNLRVGLEVIACTGNAQRVTLWDALRLSQASIESTDDPMYCAHEIGDRLCISSCWTRCRSVDDIDCDDMPRQGKPFSGIESRRVIISSILALKHSGVDSEGNLPVS